MSDLILSKQEMVILLNRASRRIDLDFPLTNDHILTLESDGVSYDVDLQLEIDESNSSSEFWDSEKPRFSDYRQCFLSSDLITYPNLNDFRYEYNGYRGLRQKVVYSLDTNLFYNQFLSTGALDPNEVLCVETVQKEITRMLNKKYSPRQLSEIKQAVRYQKNAVNEFSNGRRKSSRIVYNLALPEYQKHSDKVFAKVQTKDLVEDKEDNDLIFVEAVKEYRNTSNVYPVILTCDRQLTDLCKASGLPSFYLETPSTIEPTTATPEQVCHLICNLAGVLGVIKVNNYLVFGEFRGKRNPNEFKIQYLSGKTPIEVERDLEICRELMKLNITF